MSVKLVQNKHYIRNRGRLISYYDSDIRWSCSDDERSEEEGFILDPETQETIWLHIYRNSSYTDILLRIARRSSNA